MPLVPGFLLKQLYVKGSLKPADGGFEFRVHNRLGAGFATRMLPVTLDGESCPLEQTYFQPDDGDRVFFSKVSSDHPFTLVMGKRLTIGVERVELEPGRHKVGMGFVVPAIGKLSFEVKDEV